jgi:cytochrome c5
MKSLALFVIATALMLAANSFGADGKAIYDANCVKCHDYDGKGHTKMGKRLEIRDFSKPDTWNTFDDDDAFSAVKNGIKRDGEQVMGYKLPDDQIKASIDYMKTLTNAPAATP